MITFLTGDLLKSSSEALVNTVNCEGVMGKGMAYQFKLKYPTMEPDYKKACESGELAIGKLHYWKGDGKIIINFPTKNKWRANSKIEYIEIGLDLLIELIQEQNITSISIPPLGSGNGGLVWSDVKTIIIKKLSVLPDNISINIYEPTKKYTKVETKEPKLQVSALVLMNIKNNLNKFDLTRLQKTAYFTDLFATKKYFKFVSNKYEPFDPSIDIISKKIRDFQKYHNTSDTNQAYTILHSKLISKTTENKLAELMPFISKACDFVNNIESNHMLECCASISFLLENKSMSEQEIVDFFENYTDLNNCKFSNNDICLCIETLYNHSIIEKGLVGYYICN